MHVSPVPMRRHSTASALADAERRRPRGPTEWRRAMQRHAIAIKIQDNVATALRRLEKGETAEVGVGDRIVSIVLRDAVEFGHKFALRDIARGDDIVKYGEVIGRATADIPAGAHAHVQNIESLRGRGDLD
ncbi:UxaA family hydrolase [Rhodoplanes sp. TEM]|uniref:UxaA family hydrolase n=1 Tax=Rhodoplanes TaxID=29407 RepID=UPI00234E7499|nr:MULTISPECIES: UxaA family hydrolase [Rhodoplanes]MDC7987210.1 UxaA family hydrolase [Rhodoplanes sp. TEM]MDQ0355416.1 altronate dehydratase small subunit [Rhodoplanes tepidamans]